MLMDIFHLLLGRSWQYKMKAIHDGRRNTYTFETYGKNHVLLPLPNEEMKEEASPNTLLTSGKELLQEVEKEEFHFSWIQKPKVILTNINVNDLSKEIKNS